MSLRIKRGVEQAPSDRFTLSPAMAACEAPQPPKPIWGEYEVTGFPIQIAQERAERSGGLPWLLPIFERCTPKQEGFRMTQRIEDEHLRFAQNGLPKREDMEDACAVHLAVGDGAEPSFGTVYK